MTGSTGTVRLHRVLNAARARLPRLPGTRCQTARARFAPNAGLMINQVVSMLRMGKNSAYNVRNISIAEGGQMSAVMQETAELFREPGQAILSPNRFAQTFNLELSVLADALGVHRNTMRLHPESNRTQERLREFNRVFQALLEIRPDVQQAAFHMKNTPIRLLKQRTLFEAVADGDVDKALRYLQTISGGQNG